MDAVFQVQPVPLVKAIAEALKQNDQVELPKNHDLIKSGHGRQYSPEDADWFYVRMASIVRQTMCKGKVSLKGLAFRYGNRKNRGVRPTKFAMSSNFVNGSAIDQLKKIGWINYAQKDNILTEKAKIVLKEIIEKINEE